MEAIHLSYRVIDIVLNGGSVGQEFLTWFARTGNVLVLVLQQKQHFDSMHKKSAE